MVHALKVSKLRPPPPKYLSAGIKFMLISLKHWSPVPITVPRTENATLHFIWTDNIPVPDH